MLIRKKWSVYRVLKLCIIIYVAFYIIAISAIAVAHAVVFRRADYSGYDSEHYILYLDLNKEKYPREALSI